MDEDLVMVYVPEADCLTPEEAQQLALERDQTAAEALKADCEGEDTLNLATAAKMARDARVQTLLHELGY